MTTRFSPVVADDDGVYWMDVKATCDRSHTVSEGPPYSVCDAGSTEYSVLRATFQR